MIRKLVLFIPILLLLNSCFEEDNAVKPYNRGDITSNQVEMGAKYHNQIYFDLSTNTVVSSNLYGIWDLEFQSYDSYYIRLNSARIMKAKDLGEVDFASIDGSMKYDDYATDVPSGNKDSMALGKWWTEKDGKIVSKMHTYIIDRGKDEKSIKGGLRKLMILGADNNGYKIVYSELGAKVPDTLFVPRNDKYNFITFSFDSGGVVNNLEPPSNTWDILFTRYTALFDVPGFEVYPVTGALINTRLCYVSEADSTVDFKEITSKDLANAIFTQKRDEIGWDWKQVDINTGVYTVNPMKKYLIKDTEGFIYKLRFVGFRKVVGGKSEQGYPEFEFELL